ncbi:hypothetical protein AQJ46_28290 [Streptomyces canus]|uniref:Uncharacterized protein n=1 Tax=Streptomyces canus TaxID=58343 RepID=A0A101S076_9ACTN|nr:MULTISPECIES: hypothetical protein [Streptomyces]KUN65015.1 hypothetical protein AQJ46_28290 [Streptomyces canus]MDI5910416.1 hypothetical protein [Streptomyces sp. 12257]
MQISSRDVVSTEDVEDVAPQDPGAPPRVIPSTGVADTVSRGLVLAAHRGDGRSAAAPVLRRAGAPVLRRLGRDLGDRLGRLDGDGLGLLDGTRRCLGSSRAWSDPYPTYGTSRWAR